MRLIYAAGAFLVDADTSGERDCLLDLCGDRVTMSRAPSEPVEKPTHASSCALNNAPAYEPGPCDCAALADVETCDLNREMLRRDGVEAVFLGPEDRLTKTHFGPAWVIVNRD